LAALRKIDAAPKKKPTAAKKVPAKSSNEEAKKKQKEEKAYEDEVARAVAKRADVERLEVSKEVAVFNQRLMRIKNAFMKAGSSIVNSLRLADTNGDGRISL
jgi:primosomal protein N''